MADFGFDPELPAGFQDADLEMRALEDAANRYHRCEHLHIVIRDTKTPVGKQPWCMDCDNWIDGKPPANAKISYEED